MVIRARVTFSTIWYRVLALSSVQLTKYIGIYSLLTYCMSVAQMASSETERYIMMG